MTRWIALSAALALLLPGVGASGDEPPVSEETELCLGCHELLHPGIQAAWRQSRHAQTTPAEAIQVAGLARKVSSDSIPAALGSSVVGCAECHTLRPDEHADSFDHNGTRVHIVVTPDDCATCHAVETEQYRHNIMSYAHGNLEDNALYQDLERHLLGTPAWDASGGLRFGEVPPETEAQACLYCHGTALEVTGTETRETTLGDMEFPRIAGWPNQGVGRINPDGSRGSCAACHARHTFAIETARQPYTCKECHVGPDVPVFKVYSASKHGNIYHSRGKQWDLTSVPWVSGEDFTAPTCATCHMSLVVTPDEEVVAERTHRINDRIAWRIFGLIYSHPHPKDPNTTIIRNKDGLPLPTAFDGTPASDYLITPATQAARRETMSRVCQSCHAQSWVEGHFARYDQTHQATNQATLTGTRIMLAAWERGLAQGPNQGGSPFDESIEQAWGELWLFYANSVRFAAAMAGGGDYAVFADGHFALAKRLKELQAWLEASGEDDGER